MFLPLKTREVPPRPGRLLTGLLGFGITLVVLAGCASGPRADPLGVQPNPTPPASGMNGYQLSQLPSIEQGAQLTSMANRGVTFVRGDAPWASIQPQPPRRHDPGWRWAATDAWVQELAEHHLTWQPIIDYAVGWSKHCSGFCPPAKNSTFAAFGQAVAARYGEHGQFWVQRPDLPYYPVQTFEIWNEQNVSTFFMTPRRYATLYAAARAAIHAVDPEASVIVGGLADDSGPFVPARDYPARYVIGMFAADPRLRGRVDGFALHPYGATAADSEQWVIDFRATLDRLGESAAPIDVTEVGWPSGGDGQEQWRASMMSQIGSFLARSNCGVAEVAPYDWISTSSDPGADFGLVTELGLAPLLRPAATAWFKALAAARSLQAVEAC